jgi:hypothetical protein
MNEAITLAQLLQIRIRPFRVLLIRTLKNLCPLDRLAGADQLHLPNRDSHGAGTNHKSEALSAASQKRFSGDYSFRARFPLQRMRAIEG